MEQLLPVLVAMRGTKNPFVHKDAVRRPLQSPYDGPYQVLERGDKIFRLRSNGKDTAVLIDRIKPAFTLGDSSQEAS